jgi:uncharacterized OB-fold protein
MSINKINGGPTKIEAVAVKGVGVVESVTVMVSDAFPGFAL